MAHAHVHVNMLTHMLMYVHVCMSMHVLHERVCMHDCVRVLWTLDAYYLCIHMA